MREHPARLVELRQEVQANLGMRRDGRIVPKSQYAAMAPTEQQKCRWGPDVRVLEELVEAEQAFTSTFRGGTNTSS